MEELNQQQKQAVSHIEGPALVIAGAGSGKTRVVTFRIAHLLKIGVPASSIIAVTFTNKAADEMRQRIHRISSAFVLTCTFHSLCARILRESIAALGYTSDFTIYDEDDSEKLLKECLASLGIKDEKGMLKAIRGQISHAKNHLLNAEDFEKEDPLTAKVYLMYQKKLKESNALDFDDLLFLSVELLEKFPEILENYQKRWSFILIDEYQDTNKAQYALIKLLAAEHRNVFAVGDPDQSIYSWRGASIEHILNFERDYPGASIITLEQNYRSRPNILEAANKLISNNSSRHEKNLWSQKEPGQKIGLFIAPSDRMEADFVMQKIRELRRSKNVPLNEIVIFYRTNFQSRLFEDALLRERTPYVIIGGLSFYQRKEIKDVIALLRLALGSSDLISVLRTINLPRRGIGAATLEKMRAVSEVEGVDLFAVCVGIVQRRFDFKVSQKQYEGLKDYVETILALREMKNLSMPLSKMIDQAVLSSRYFDYLKEDPETFEERKGNVDELISKAAEWTEERETPTLAAFLEELSLKSSADESNLAQESVRMMTLHHGKGLEFTAVFMVGMEEDLFPHVNSKGKPEAVEEERRLCYVGMTRAKEYLYLTAAQMRFLWGTSRAMQPSRFLDEIPEEYLEIYHKPTAEFEEDEEQIFSPGASVLHRDFGRGIVQKSYRSSLGLTYDVFFPQMQAMRTLVAKYARLKALPSFASNEESY